ncbi:MAG: hypothetical protein ACREK1_11115, partial [Longimicrobiales bacterium]
VVNAYLNPHVPEPRLVRRVEAALRNFDTMLEATAEERAETLPNYDMQDGSIVDAERHVA